MLKSSLKTALVKSFGNGVLSRDNKNFAICCPSCNDKRKTKKKLVVRLDTGVFHCWVCGLKGKNVEYLFRKYSPEHLASITGFKSKEQLSADEDVMLPKGLCLISESSNDPDLLAVKKYFGAVH